MGLNNCHTLGMTQDANPTGKTSHKWFAAGYQKAMRDILNEMINEGPEAAIKWAQDNCRDYELVKKSKTV